jgi:hypothetical protein
VPRPSVISWKRANVLSATRNTSSLKYCRGHEFARPDHGGDVIDGVADQARRDLRVLPVAQPGPADGAIGHRWNSLMAQVTSRSVPSPVAMTVRRRGGASCQFCG